MLQPKKVKYRKPHTPCLRGQSKGGNKLVFGDFGLQVLEAHWLSARQIEAARRVITRYTKRDGQLWIRIFPDHSITRRAAETRMGSGKGTPEFWVAIVKPGKILYELKGVSEWMAKKALLNAAFKLPMKTRFIQRNQK